MNEKQLWIIAGAGIALVIILVVSKNVSAAVNPPSVTPGGLAIGPGGSSGISSGNAGNNPNAAVAQDGTLIASGAIAPSTSGGVLGTAYIAPDSVLGVPADIFSLPNQTQLGYMGGVD